MKLVIFDMSSSRTTRAVGNSQCRGLRNGVGLAGVGDLSGLRAESGERGDDLGHVGGSGAVLGVVVRGSDGGRGEASHGGGSDSSGETHFDIR
jgi:hypothetical protein